MTKIFFNFVEDMLIRWDRTCGFWAENFHCEWKEVLVVVWVIIVLGFIWCVS